MEYLNVPTALFSSPEFIGSEPVERATWIALLAWCCEQENEGRIVSCRSWKDRRWMQTCGVMASEIGEGCDLYGWDGDDLVVFGYPHNIQCRLNNKRDTARENGKKGGRPKTKVGTYVGTKMETYEKPMLVSEETDVGSDVGTHVGTEMGTDVETYAKSGRKEGNLTYNSVGVNSTVVSSGFPRTCPPQDDEMWQWFVSSVCSLKPDWRKYNLSPDETTAAEAAYLLFMGDDGELRIKEEDFALLRAYFADKTAEDRRGKPFWRDMGRQRFLMHLGDVLTNHARRWAKEIRWKLGGRTERVVGGEKPGEGGGSGGVREDEEFMSPEEVARMMRRMKGGM